MMLELFLRRRDDKNTCEKLVKLFRNRLALVIVTCSIVWLCLNAVLAVFAFNVDSVERYMQQNYIDMLNSEKYYRFPTDKKFSIDKPFIISNRNLCKHSNPYMIVVVPSRIANFEERHAIRATYGSMSRDKISRINDLYIEHTVRVVFVLGVPENVADQEQIDREYVQYGDLVQVDILDTYYNLTYKMLYAFRWVNTYCYDVKYVLKCDDDTFVHIGRLFQQLETKIPYRNGSIYGKIYSSKKHLEVQRWTTKWKVSDTEYPLRKYPRYAQGSSYTMTFDLIPKILKRAIYLPYLHNEDVFLTGIISGKILGAELVSLNKTSDWTEETPDPCKFVVTERLAMSNMSPERMYKTWMALSTNAYMCDKTLYDMTATDKPT